MSRDDEKIREDLMRQLKLVEKQQMRAKELMEKLELKRLDQEKREEEFLGQEGIRNEVMKRVEE